MITYREMRESDYPYLADMCWKMWADDTLKKDPANAVYYGYMVLYYELVKHSAAFVSVDDGKPVGLLILDIKDGHPVHMDAVEKLIDASMKLCSTPAGLKNQRDWNDLEVEYKGNGEAIAEKEHFDAEIQLFINDADHRRQGVGSGMFRYMANYLHDHGCKTFYLHTDQCSKHQFYGEKRHMKELNKRKSSVDIGDVHNADLFIYSDTVEHQMDL